MKQSIAAVIAVLSMAVSGCGGDRSIDGSVYIESIDRSPVEVDCVRDEEDSPFLPEEVTVNLRFEPDPAVAIELQANAIMTSYRIDYVLSTGDDLPFYDNGVSLFLAPGESKGLPIRAVSYVQKDECKEFADAVNATATLTLTGHADDNSQDEFELRGDFDIIFDDFIVSAAPPDAGI